MPCFSALVAFLRQKFSSRPDPASERPVLHIGHPTDCRKLTPPTLDGLTVEIRCAGLTDYEHTSLTAARPLLSTPLPQPLSSHPSHSNLLWCCPPTPTPRSTTPTLTPSHKSSAASLAPARHDSVYSDAPAPLRSLSATPPICQPPPAVLASGLQASRERSATPPRSLRATRSLRFAAVRAEQVGEVRRKASSPLLLPPWEREGVPLTGRESLLLDLAGGVPRV